MKWVFFDPLFLLGVGNMSFEIENKLPEIKELIAGQGLELIEYKFRKSSGYRSVLTFLVDKQGGINMEECVRVNRALSNGPLEDFSGILEVNSPGLDRPLKLEADFIKVLGNAIRVVAPDAAGHVSGHSGELLSVKDGMIEIRTKDKEIVEKFMIADIVRAVREINFKRDL